MIEPNTSRASYESWQAPPEGPLRLSSGEVHLWRISLVRPQTELDALRRTLSPDELLRADRFYFERHREAFVVARGTLRRVLALYVNASPENISFRYAYAGKPELARGDEFDHGAVDGDLRFNLSHSGDVALLAVALASDVGVDVEQIREMNDAAGIARRYFSASEFACWEGLSDVERPAGFFRCWTRKEAYLKALGDGLRAPLDKFVVTLGPDEPPELLQCSPHDEHGRWTMADVSVGDGYLGAVVMHEGFRITSWYDG